jgi:hypothetical protein
MSAAKGVSRNVLTTNRESEVEYGRIALNITRGILSLAEDSGLPFLGTFVKAVELGLRVLETQKLNKENAIQFQGTLVDALQVV